MAKRNDPVARARARGRKTAPVRKPFPVGFVLGSLALAGFLIAILVYSFANQGIGDKSSLKYAESAIDGLKSDHKQTANHKPSGSAGFQKLSYPNDGNTPPIGGDHNGTPQSCQVYTTPVASEHVVHSMEHGAVWVTYNPDKLSAKDIEKLKDKVDGDPYRLLSPYPGLKTAVSLQAWAQQLFVDSANDDRIDEFLELFTSGPQTELTGERGAPCSGTTQSRDQAYAQAIPVPTASPTGSPAPTGSASPSPSASPK